MFVERELPHVLARLGGAHSVLSDIVIPVEQPVLPSNCYREEYAWQHSYERQLLRKANQWLEKHRHDLIGSQGLLSEALSNAYAHGNHRDSRLPIFVELFVGHEGYVLRITHSGGGFCVATVLAQYRRHAHYYNVGGNGIRKFDESRTFRAFYDRTGQAIHLWYDSQRSGDDTLVDASLSPHSASDSVIPSLRK